MAYPHDLLPTRKGEEPILEGSEMDVSVDEYIEYFNIRRSAHFVKNTRVPGRQWSFVFAAGTLPMSYRSDSYWESQIVIDLSRDDTDGNMRYYVTSIESR